MKHGKLHGVARNLADSLAGGLSFVVPNNLIYASVYAEAAANPDGFVEVDLLKGTVIGAFPGGELESAVSLFSAAFPAFCSKHDVDHSDYSECRIRYVARVGGNGYLITVGDRNGVRTVREYVGSKGKRSKEMDRLGRLRPKIIPPPET